LEKSGGWMGCETFLSIFLSPAKDRCYALGMARKPPVEFEGACYHEPIRKGHAVKIGKIRRMDGLRGGFCHVFLSFRQRSLLCLGMARKPRIEFEGACYHVINRGNYRSDVFATDKTKAAFEKCLFEACGADPKGSCRADPKGSCRENWKNPADGWVARRF
jgi:hypothetical protein